MGQLGLIQKGGDTNDTISGIICTIAGIFGVFRGIFRYILDEMLQKATIIKKQRGIFPKWPQASGVEVEFKGKSLYVGACVAHVSRRDNNHTHTHFY